MQSRTLGLILYAIGSLTLSIALVIAIFNYDFLQHAEKSQGLVGPPELHCPVRFRSHEHDVHVARGLRPHASGERLTVLYLPHNPAESMISGEEWDVTLLVATLGATHLIAGILGVFGCVKYPEFPRLRCTLTLQTAE